MTRVLGPFDATCIVIGAVIGVGIFFTPSRVALVAGSGPMAMGAWVAGGLVAMLGALTFAELGSVYTGSGAQYEILRDAYGPLPAFVFVFCNATAIQAGATAIIAVVCAQNLGVLFAGAVPDDRTVLGLSSLLILLLVVANVCGAKLGSGITNATAVARVLTLLVIGIMAISFSKPATLHVQPGAASSPTAWSPGFVGFFAAMVPACFCYGGWQHALWIAGEVRDAHRNVPRAIVAGMLVVVAGYVTANWAYLHLLGYQVVADTQTIAADAVGAAWQNGGRRAVAGAVAVSAFGVLNAQLLSGPRLVYGMAIDGRFFKPFARINQRHRTPHAAIVLIGAIALVLLFAAGQQAVDKLLTGVVAIDSTFFALTGLAVLVLRRKRPTPPPVCVPGYPLVPAAFGLAEFGVVVGAFWDSAVRPAALLGAAWVLAAGACFVVFFRRTARRSV